MSQVMNALQHSEQNRQAMLTSYQASSNRNYEADQPRLKWSYMLMLGVLPIVAVGSYLGLEAYQANEQLFISEPHPVVSAPVTQIEVEQLEAETVISPMEQEMEFRILNYPVHSQLEPVPKLSEIEPVAPSEAIDESNNTLVELDALVTPTPSLSPKKSNQDAFSSAEQDMGLEELDLSSLSPELALKFQSALQATADSDSLSANEKLSMRETIDIDKTGDQYQGRLPALNLQTHMYSSDRERRWVKINDHEYSEGDWIENQIQLWKIKPQSVVVEFEGQLLELPALYEWQG